MYHIYYVTLVRIFSVSIYGEFMQLARRVTRTRGLGLGVRDSTALNN